MKYPDEIDLMALFEFEPHLLDSKDIPFFYNQSTYQYTNKSNQIFTVKLQPSSNELEILVKKGPIQLFYLKFNTVSGLSILKDTKGEKRIMITSDNFISKMNLNPEFQFELVEERDMH